MSISDRISLYNRTRKLRLFLDLVKPGPETRVLDVGYTDEEYRPMDNLLEKCYPYPEKITALGVEDYTIHHNRLFGLTLDVVITFGEIGTRTPEKQD